VPWSGVDSTPFVPATTSATLAQTLAAMHGLWIGHAVAPQYWTPERWDLVLDLTPDETDGGHFTARTSTGSPSFYYGTDESDCAAMRRYRLFDFGTQGVAGAIDIPFPGGSPSCHLPVWQGELSNIAFDAKANRLRLSFSRSDGYGPIDYDLWRVCPNH
jgi:hypothetical protein